MTFAAPSLQQRARQAAGAGADLDDDGARQRPGGAGDAACQVEIEQKILAKRLFGFEAVGRDDLAQRRQAVMGETHAAASRAARRAASIRLVGLARPLPAMSKAVP